MSAVDTCSGGRRNEYVNISRKASKESGSSLLRIIKTPAPIRTAGQKNCESRYQGNQSKFLSKSRAPTAIRMIGPMGRFVLQASNGSVLAAPDCLACATRIESNAM